MRKILPILLMLSLFIGNVFTQQKEVFKIQGIPRPDMKVRPIAQTKAKRATESGENFTFDDIKFWAGEGAYQAALVVDWYDDKGSTLVWGFQWEGDAFGVNIFDEVAKNDSRFYYLKYGETQYGTAIGGIGFDANNDGKFELKRVSTGEILTPDENGVYSTNSYDFDDYDTVDPEDHWQSGWTDRGYWSYQVKDAAEDDFSYSGLGASSRKLVDGCWDGWAFQVGWDSWEGVLPKKPFVAVLPIELDQNTTTLNVGTTLQLNASIYQTVYKDKEIVWTSSDEKVAYVDSNGKVKGLKGGTATITAQVAEFCYATCEVTVNAEEANVNYDDLVYWVGEGQNQTGVIIQWNDEKEKDVLAWGYKWDGKKTVLEMLKDIAKVDERLFMLLNEEHPTNVLAGLGFDLNGEGKIGILQNGNTIYPIYPLAGVANVKVNDYDQFDQILDAEDHWFAGINKNGVWNHLVLGAEETSFSLSLESILNKELENASWNAWNFDVEFKGVALGKTFNPVSEYVREEIDYTKGIFFVNEDWFGHTNGSLNFLTDEGKWVYRAYTRENPGQAFGATAQFGTIYGENFFFVSKQEKDGGDTQYTPGGRLVVANAETLEKKAGFDVLAKEGGTSVGDGRSFLGVDEQTGYIGGNGGVALFDIPSMTIGEVIEGTSGGGQYNGQVGTMLRIGDYVFAVKQGQGVLVIDVATHTVKELIECKAAGTIVQSKDGFLWMSAYDTKTLEGLWKINPYTLEVEKKIVFPDKSHLIPSTWGAWTSGVMAASDKTNTLYWAKMNGSTMTFFGTKVYKFDIEQDDLESTAFFETPFYELTGYEGKEAFYGSGLKVNPATNEVVITTTRTGYLNNYQKNRVHILDGETGDVNKIYELDDYYWFPAMSVFPDKLAPVVSDDLNDLTIEAETRIFLGDKVTDADSFDAAIIKSIVSNSDESILTAVVRSDSLILTPKEDKHGESSITLKFNSNGKVVEKTIKVSKDQKVEAISLNESVSSLLLGETIQLTATVTPEDATNKNVVWSSDEESIATVDETGLVKAVGIGEATITVTTEEGGKTATCKVKVIDPTVYVTGVKISDSHRNLITGDAFQLSATVSPKEATNKEVAWSSDKESVATVDETGAVKAIGVGRAIITVTTVDGGHKATCTVTVSDPVVVVTGVELNETSKELEVDETFQLSASVSPANATNKTIVWTSSNESVATVDETGVVKAVAVGSATITVTTEDGTHTATCEITVKEDGSVGVDKVGGADILVYPTVTTGTIHITQLQNEETVQIFDFSGRLVLSEKLQAGDNTIHIHSFNKGIYFVKVGDKVVKVVKQ